MEVFYGSKKATMAKHQQSVTHTTRPPLLPAEKNNAVAVTRHPRTMEVSSRFRSPTPTKNRRCPSPNVTRTVSSSSQSISKRAVSAERKRSLTPTTPSNPSTPVSDVSIDLPVSSRRLSAARLPESLWPSTMRSLSVSFQSDSVSVPVIKKEKPSVTSSVDRTLRPSSNIGLKQQSETTSVLRKHTPERKRSPLKGKNVSGQSENSKPVDGLHSRLIEQHRWPSKITSNSMNRSLDLGDKAVRKVSLPLSRSSKPLQKSSSDTARLLSSYENGGQSMSPTNSEDGHSLTWTTESHRLLSASSLDRTILARVHPLSAPGSRAASPSRSSFSSSSSNSRGMSPSRGVSPLRGLSPSRGANLSCLRSSTPPPRGVSPSRLRQTNTSAQSGSTAPSVLSFIADVKKGKKAAYIEDVHQLRLIYNRYSQWRFANARAERVRYIQRLIAEETLYNVWHATSDLRDLVTNQRICLQQLKLEIKLESILNDQMVCLEDWATLERDHISSLAGAIGDLEANTLRLPLTGKTKADLESLKVAMSSAIDIMQTMGSSIWSLYTQMEEMNKLVSDLAVIATKENFMLDKCEDLLASTAVMEIEESSLMTHLIQKKQEEEEEERVRDDAEVPLLPLSKFPWP